MSEVWKRIDVWEIEYHATDKPKVLKTMRIDAEVNQSPEEALQVVRGCLDTCAGGPFKYQQDYKITAVKLIATVNQTPSKH